MIKYVLILSLLSVQTQSVETQLPPRVLELIDELIPLLEELRTEEQITVHSVSQGENLQWLFDTIKGGDIIELQEGAVFTGNFTIGAKESVVLVRGSARLHSPNNQPALATVPQARNWVFDQTLFTAEQPNGTVVRIGSSHHALIDVPNNITFKNCFIHGNEINGGKRGIELNGANLVVDACEIIDFKVKGQDAQAIAVWNGPGPIRIINSKLQASGEVILVGGSDPSIPNLIPSDILIQNNNVSKPLSWKGEGWTIKNLIELKAGRRVTIRGNIVENNWLHAQAGYALVLKSTNQDGKCPWCETTNVTVDNNTIRNVSGGISLSGRPEVHPAVDMNNITIRNNLVKTNRKELGGDGRCLVISGVDRVTFESNTCDNDGVSTIVFGEARPNREFSLVKNILVDLCAGSCWGIKGSGASEGYDSILKWAPDALYKDNLVITPTVYLYGPADWNTVRNIMPIDTSLFGYREITK